MASLIYNSALDDLARGNIDFDTDAFKVMLVTDAYVEDKGGHLKRSDVTGEVLGAGYTADGEDVQVTVTKDVVNNRIDITLGGAAWDPATITARKAVYYKSRGGAATADELVAVNDFGTDVSSTAAQFALAASTLRIQN